MTNAPAPGHPIPTQIRGLCSRTTNSTPPFPRRSCGRSSSAPPHGPPGIATPAVSAYPTAPTWPRTSPLRWTTFGVSVVSAVREFVHAQRLAWDGHALGSTGYHRWELTPHPTVAATSSPKKSNAAPAARLLAPLMRRGRHREHQHRLEALVATAQQENA